MLVHNHKAPRYMPLPEIVRYMSRGEMQKADVWALIDQICYVLVPESRGMDVSNWMDMINLRFVVHK